MNKSIKEKIVLFVACAFAVSFGIAIAVTCTTSFFLDSRFTADDAAPLTSPYITSGGQSVTVTETDGTLAIASDALVVTAQSSAVDGDLGLRYDTNAGTYLGRAVFFTIIPTTLANGISGTGNISNVFGFTDAANVQIANAYDYGFGTTASQWIHFATSSVSAPVNLPVLPPVVNDTFYVCYIMGGGSSINQSTSEPWYSGATPSTYDKGHFIFMKQGAAGAWRFAGYQNSDFQSGGTTRYPIITNYNSAFKVLDWFVPADTLRDDIIGGTLLSPLYYQNMAGTGSSQLFDDAAEVGASMDSVKGNFVFNAGGTAVTANGSDPDATLHWISTVDTGDDEVYSGALIVCQGGTSPASMGIVLRYNPANSHHILVQIADGSPDNVRIFRYDGSYTQVALDNTGISLSNSAGYLYAYIYDYNDSTRVYAGWLEHNGADETHNLSYTHAGLFNAGQTQHGIRQSAVNTANTFNSFHVRAIGTGVYSPYDSLLACYFEVPVPEMSVKGNNTEIVDGDATPSASDSTDFGEVVTVGATRKVTYTITNSGTGALTLSGSPKVAIGGTHAADFTVTTQPSSPVSSGGGTVTFVVEFDPSSTGVRSATLSIDNDDSDENPYNWSIQGTGVTREIAVSGNGQDITSGDATPSTGDNTNFGRVIIEETISYVFTISNSGTSNLTLIGTPKVAISGDDEFTVTSQPSSPVAGSGSTTFTIKFAPTAKGNYSATVSIANDDSDENPFTFALSGIGAAGLGKKQYFRRRFQ